MPLGLRLFLIAGSLLTAVYVLSKIRKNRMSMETSIFWILFSLVLVLLGIFPDIAGWFAGLLGVQSTVNLVYLVIIFLLLVKVFIQDQREARLERQMARLVQTVALERERQGQSPPPTVSDEGGRKPSEQQSDANDSEAARQLRAEVRKE